jgi:hypothetical protein
MPTLVTVFPAVLKAQKRKKTNNFDKFHKIPRGGVRAQAQCFLWGLFFNKSLLVTFSTIFHFWGSKNHEPSTFLVRTIFAKIIVF